MLHGAGSRLTAYELVHDGIPATLIADSAAGALLAAGRVDAVVTGADRVAANGDTANKIGTLSLAVNARACGCAMPSSHTLLHRGLCTHTAEPCLRRGMLALEAAPSTMCHSTLTLLSRLIVSSSFLSLVRRSCRTGCPSS